MREQTNEEKLLLAKIDDLYQLCDKYGAARFSMFLDAAAQRTVCEYTAGRTGGVWSGGYEQSERRMFGVFPEWDTECRFPICILHVTYSFGEPLSHRDYLGSVLSHGIDRGKIGDILVSGGGAYVFVQEDISQYLIQNLVKIGNRGVKVRLCEPDEVSVPERALEEREIVVSSMRLDAVIAAVMNISRSTAADYIQNGRVSVEHRICEVCSQTVGADELISVRGFGRFFIGEEGGMTRKGRRHATVKKYI